MTVGGVGGVVEQIGQVFGEAGADDDDVALAEVDARFFGDGLDVLEADDVLVEGVELEAVLVGPALEVDEDAAGRDAAEFVPIF